MKLKKYYTHCKDGRNVESVKKMWYSVGGGARPGFARGGPAKVAACKSILFNESSRVVKIKNSWLIILLHFCY